MRNWMASSGDTGAPCVSMSNIRRANAALAVSILPLHYQIPIRSTSTTHLCPVASESGMLVATTAAARELAKLRDSLNQPAAALAVGRRQCRHPASTQRLTSRRSNGFANTSQAPRFKASAQRYSSASLDVTISDGADGSALVCSSMSIHVPGSRSRSQTTTAMSCCCNKLKAATRS